MVLSIEEWLRQSKPDGRVSKSGMWEGEDSTGCGGNAHACGVCHQFFADEQTAGKFKDELDISCQTDRDEGHVNTTHQVNIPQALISFLIPLMENVGYIFTLLSGSTASPRFEESWTRIIT